MRPPKSPFPRPALSRTIEAPSPACSAPAFSAWGIQRRFFRAVASLSSPNPGGRNFYFCSVRRRRPPLPLDMASAIGAPLCISRRDDLRLCGQATELALRPRHLIVVHLRCRLMTVATVRSRTRFTRTSTTGIRCRALSARQLPSDHLSGRR